MNSKLVVVIEVDVTDVESQAEAREAAFELARPLLLLSKKRGPKVAGPRAIVTGISVEEVEARKPVDETVSSDTVRE